MKDKQEQIKEIANDLNSIRSLQASEIYTPIYQEAMALFYLGYRKIDEDCVVITKDELKQYKVQAVKEFAEKLKKKYGKSCSEYYPMLIEMTSYDIDELLKEYENDKTRSNRSL